ncbi:MAG: hypothetical protein JXR48_07285 [Candidatus Delongbacteria bacterium]|nr:hypothetical protein [Candidatus Delongbacteria bacterium]MBN2834754.1 hypothetical protein [Candidatus Delongbacteria bacterium]
MGKKVLSSILVILLVVLYNLTNADQNYVPTDLEVNFKFHCMSKYFNSGGGSLIPVNLKIPEFHTTFTGSDVYEFPLNDGSYLTCTYSWYPNQPGRIKISRDFASPGKTPSQLAIVEYNGCTQISKFNATAEIEIEEDAELTFEIATDPLLIEQVSN